MSLNVSDFGSSCFTKLLKIYYDEYNDVSYLELVAMVSMIIGSAEQSLVSDTSFKGKESIKFSEI